MGAVVACSDVANVIGGAVVGATLAIVSTILARK